MGPGGLLAAEVADVGSVVLASAGLAHAFSKSVGDALALKYALGRRPWS